MHSNPARTSRQASIDPLLLDELSDRIQKLEKRLPKSRIVSKKFWPRAFAVCGHHFAAFLPVYIPIVLIIATIAIPSLLRSRQAANESSAVANLRTINTAEVTYLASTGQYGDMQQLVDSGLLDTRFLETVSGYNFSVSARGGDYVATATPNSVNSGRWAYYSTQEGIVRYSDDATAAPANQAGNPVY